MSVRLTEAAAEVHLLRRRALEARERYDRALHGFDVSRLIGGVVSEFEAARVLGIVGGEVGDLLADLDDAGDTAGFHAGYESAAALRALVEAAG